MLDKIPPAADRTKSVMQSSSDPVFCPYEVIDGRFDGGMILICDHARNFIPPQYKNLGLPKGELERHIAYDIGAEAVTRKVAARLGIPAVMALFSRLLIDPNRGTDDPTLIMRLSDCAIVPGNAELTQDERENRIRTYYQPYHDAVERVISRAQGTGCSPLIFAIHSFTPMWKGVQRPWHAGVLWEKDDSFARPVLEALARDRNLVVGENQPYSGGVEGESVDKHARQRGLAAALIEIRQDLIANDEGVDEWAERLATILEEIITDGNG